MMKDFINFSISAIAFGAAAGKTIELEKTWEHLSDKDKAKKLLFIGFSAAAGISAIPVILTVHYKAD